MRASFLTGFFLLWLAPALCVAVTNEYPWVLKKNADGIRVYTRKVEGSLTMEFKATVVVDVSLDEVVRLYEETDHGRMTEWFFRCKEVRLLQKKSPDDKIFYVVVSMPRPIRDRDLVIRRLRKINPETGVVEYYGEAVAGILPEQPDRVRIPLSKSYWRLKSIGNTRTEISYQQHSKIGGSIPPWLENFFAVNAPLYSLKNLRRILLEEKNKSEDALKLR